MNARDVGKLKTNLIHLPKQIVDYERKGRTADAENCRRILAYSREQIAKWEAKKAKALTTGHHEVTLDDRVQN